MEKIFTALLYELEKGHDCILVSIVSDRGSAPRGKGSQMLISGEGRVQGTIGGGAVEKYSEDMARSLLPEKRSALHLFTLRANDREDIGMVCGWCIFSLLTTANPIGRLLPGNCWPVSVDSNRAGCCCP